MSSQIKKPISTSLSPNTEKDDIFLAFRLFFRFNCWKKGKTIEILEEKFKNYLGVKYAFSFNSGRSSLMAILAALEIKENDEILLQGFTCNSAVIPILKIKAKPVFVDIDETLNLDPKDLEKKITSKSKAIMIQHTFGFPAKIDEILAIVKKNNLLLIEDCAHALGSKFDNKACGTFGEVAFFSFGRDKIISSVFGGMVATDSEETAKKIKNFREKLNYPSNFWIFQQLLHPVLINKLILKLYRVPVFGKFTLIFFQKIKILSKAVHKKEKKGKIPSYFPKRMPNALANLALNQLEKLEKFNRHRKEIVRFYEEELKKTGFSLPFLKKEKKGVVFMRYPILVNDSDAILKEARKERILLNDGWRKSPIVPPDTNIKKMEYVLGSCPKAEEAAEKMLNLPTHINISKNNVKRIIDFLKDYENKRNNR